MNTIPCTSASDCGLRSEAGNTAVRCDDCLTWWPRSSLRPLNTSVSPPMLICPRCQADRGQPIHRDPVDLQTR